MADYKGVLVELRARLATIDKERADLDTAIAAIERLANSAVSGGPAVGADAGEISPRAFVGLTMPQAITKYFTLVDKPQTTRPIMDALKAGGLKGKGGLRGHVYNTLHRLSQENGPFRREPDSRWSLREWPSVESERPDSQNALFGGAAH